jgi:cytochrome c553
MLSGFILGRLIRANMDREHQMTEVLPIGLLQEIEAWKEVPVTMTQPSKPSRSLLVAAAALPFALAAAVAPGAACADDNDGSSFSRGELRGKIGYCTDCHGTSGQGYFGFYTMPRLAGQTPEYLVNQLRAFAERRRDGGLPIKLSRIHSIRPGLRMALANHFSGLNPKTMGRGPSELVGSGRKIYQEGVPDANVPACAACHGPQAQGSGPTARLAGQLYRYTRKQLSTWSKGRGSDNEQTAIMQTIANTMSKQQIDAVAAYLNSLK